RSSAREARSPQSDPRRTPASRISTRCRAQLRNECLSRGTGWRVLAPCNLHRQVSNMPLLALDLDANQAPLVDIFLHDVHGHVAPTEAGTQKGLLGTHVGKAPSQRRQHPEIASF